MGHDMERTSTDPGDDDYLRSGPPQGTSSLGGTDSVAEEQADQEPSEDDTEQS
jgi:hypothetical protein